MSNEVTKVENTLSNTNNNGAVASFVDGMDGNQKLALAGGVLAVGVYAINRVFNFLEKNEGEVVVEAPSGGKLIARRGNNNKA